MEYDFKKEKIEAAKQAKLNKKKFQAEQDEIDAKRLKCFWTWPWGHKYEYFELRKKCIICGTEKYYLFR